MKVRHFLYLYIVLSLVYVVVQVPAGVVHIEERSKQGRKQAIARMVKP